MRRRAIIDLAGALPHAVEGTVLSITMPELESKLTAAHAKDPDMPVVIKGDPQAYYSLVVDIIDMG